MDIVRFFRYALRILAVFYIFSSGQIYAINEDTQSINLGHSIIQNLARRVVENQQDIKLFGGILLGSAAVVFGGYYGYKKYQQRFQEPNDLSNDINAHLTTQLERFYNAKRDGQRLLDLIDKPCVNHLTNEFIRSDIGVTPLVLGDSFRVWQPLVLWQSTTNNKQVNSISGEAFGMNNQALKKCQFEVNLGNPRILNKYVKEEEIKSLAGGPLSCAYQSLKNVACLFTSDLFTK